MKYQPIGLGISKNNDCRELVGNWPGAKELFDLLVEYGASESEAAIYVLSLQVGDVTKHTLPTVAAAIEKMDEGKTK